MARKELNSAHLGVMFDITAKIWDPLMKIETFVQPVDKICDFFKSGKNPDKVENQRSAEKSHA